MQKYAVLYATYAEVYILHILHLYALPTLLMVTAAGLRLLSVWQQSRFRHVAPA